VEKMLQRIASQLGAYDEASLLSLWDKYHREVRSFQPTQQWEESVLILCLLQSVRWKNQLFNSKWMEQRSADFEPERDEDTDGGGDEEPGPEGRNREGDGAPRGRVIAFPTEDRDSS